MTKTIQRISRAESFKVYDFLKDKIADVPNQKGILMCTYLQAWDDQKVAQVLKISEKTVSNIRREMFGKIKDTAITSGKRGSLDLRLSHIENYLTSQNAKWRELLL